MRLCDIEFKLEDGGFPLQHEGADLAPIVRLAIAEGRCLWTARKLVVTGSGGFTLYPSPSDEGPQ